MAELADRRDEVLETFRREGMRQERAYLIECREGPLLVYVMDADDIDVAGAAYRASDLPVDRDHAQVMATVLEEAVAAELMYEAP